METLFILKNRFEQNGNRHPDIFWDEVEKKIQANSNVLASIEYMESTGGEPDVIGRDESGKLILCDCSKESPNRRSVCYDKEARLGRKKNAPETSALEEAQKHGLTLLDQRMYERLQSIGEFDLSSSSWIKAPDDIRSKGGALFMEKRYGHVFVFHNGADSYYSNRGWRGFILL